MSLRINTNVAALNSYNNLNANQAKLEGAFQQLSSGLRINKAADDAAGLSIAQGLTSQINGLTQAVSNANDGINVAQIADGALGTTQDILQRMRGLVVKAANVGTQDSKSLGAITQEIKNLNTQLDNIAGQTKFGQTNLLDGSYNKNFQVGANGGDTIALNLANANVASSHVGGSQTAGGSDLNGISIAVGVSQVISGTIADGAAVTPDAAGASATLAGQAAAMLGIKSSDGATYASASGVISVGGNPVGKLSLDSNTGEYTVAKYNSDDASYTTVGKIQTANFESAFALTSTTSSIDSDSVSGKLLQEITGISSAASNQYAVTYNGGTSTWTITDNGGGSAKTLGTLTKSGDTYKFAESTTAWTGTGNKITAGASDDTAYISNGTAGQTYSTDQATADLKTLDTAIDAISQARSGIGAVQNQLGYTVSNLQTAITNVTASRSNLTDADLAQQVTAMTQSQILTQAATSVLAQANSAPQAILKLLQ